METQQATIAVIIMKKENPENSADNASDFSKNKQLIVFSPF